MKKILLGGCGQSDPAAAAAAAAYLKNRDTTPAFQAK